MPQPMIVVTFTVIGGPGTAVSVTTITKRTPQALRDGC